MENKMNEIEITDLEVEIATELALYSKLTGKSFWNEVARLATFGDSWQEQD